MGETTRQDQGDFDALDDAWMSIPRAAKFLGISTTTMRDLIDKRRIRFYRPSVQPRIKLADLVQYQQQRCRRSRREMTVMEDLIG